MRVRTLSPIVVPVGRPIIALVALLDTGILMTFGNGANGCLGHGNLVDVKAVVTHLSIAWLA